MSTVYVIIVNWNGWRDTIECLESVFSSDFRDFRVIVIDNSSGDDSLERIADWAENRLQTPVHPVLQKLMGTGSLILKPIHHVIYEREDAERGGRAGIDAPLILVRVEENLGFAGGNNVGMRYALARGDCSYVWLLNNDTVVYPDALSRLTAEMERTPQAGICGSTLLHYNRPDMVQAYGGAYYCKWIGLPWHIGRLKRIGTQINVKRALRWTNYVVGASMFVRREFLEEVGLMREDYFLYFEELDWVLRGKGRYRLAYAPESVVYHKVGKSIGTSSNPARKSAVCDYFNIRNRLFFTRRYYPQALPTIYLTLIGALLVRIAYCKWDRVVMILRTMVNYRFIDRRYLPEGSCSS